MQVRFVLLAGLVGFVAAQSNSSTSRFPTTSATNSSSSVASITSTSVSPTQTCLSKCQSGDVNCQAACVGVPYPNAAQINATTACSSQCAQGNGTQAETQHYADCMAACRALYFLSTGTNFVGAAATSSASHTSGVSSQSASTTMSGSASTAGSSTLTSGSAVATASRAAAVSDVRAALAAPLAGLVGMMLAALTL